MHFISASLADIEVSPSLAAAGKDTVTGVFVRGSASHSRKAERNSDEIMVKHAAKVGAT